MPLHHDGTYRQGGLDSPFNICTGWSSWYADDLDEVRHMARAHGVRFVNSGYADEEYIEEGVGQIGGTLMTRRTDESLDLFHLFRDEEDFECFLPVTRVEATIALDALKAHRAPAPWVLRSEYDRLHENTQALYRRVWDEQTKTETYELRETA